MTSPGRALVAGVDPAVVAAAVLACPAVAALSGGPAGSAATYLPGRRVRGVVVREAVHGGPPDVAVHVVALFGTPIAEVAGQVRAATSATAPGSRTDVHVDDVLLPGQAVEDQDLAGPMPADGSALRSDPLTPPAPSRPQPGTER